MQPTWQEFRSRIPGWLKAGGLLLAGLTALFFAGVQPLKRASVMDDARVTGLSDRYRASESFGRPGHILAGKAEGVVGGVPGGAAEGGSWQAAELDAQATGASASGLSNSGQTGEDRKLVRTGAIDLVVEHPAEAAERIRQLAERSGGFLVSSRVGGGQDATGGEVVVRVPVARFEEIRAEIRKLGLRVGSDRLETQDVTRDYVDREARLRNLRAQEQQYLTILKHATTVKDTLEVSDKLNQVRGEIDQQQAEFDALSKQVETVALTVTLASEAEAQVFGLHWRPMYRLKMAARDGLDGLADYLGTVIAIAFYLPTIMLWVATILIAAAIAWRILKWAGRRLFGFFKPTPLANEAKP